MGPWVATLVTRAIEVRRVLRHASTEAICEFWRQAPNLTSVSSAAGIAAAIALSKLFPTGAVETPPSRSLLQLDAEPLGHPVERPTIDAEDLGGARPIAVRSVEDVEQVAALEIVERGQIGERVFLVRSKSG